MFPPGIPQRTRQAGSLTKIFFGSLHSFHGLHGLLALLGLLGLLVCFHRSRCLLCHEKVGTCNMQYTSLLASGRWSEPRQLQTGHRFFPAQHKPREEHQTSASVVLSSLKHSDFYGFFQVLAGIAPNIPLGDFPFQAKTAISSVKTQEATCHNKLNQPTIKSEDMPNKRMPEITPT